MKAGKQRGRSGVSIGVFRKLVLELPDVVDCSTERGLAFRTSGRMLLCSALHKSAEPGSIVVRIGAEQRVRLLAEHPDALYLTEHYANHPAVLARLSRLDRESLREVLSAAWAFVSEEAAGRKRPRLRRAKR